MSDAKDKKQTKNTKKITKKDENAAKKKGAKSTYKKDLSKADFLSVEETCNRFDGKILKLFQELFLTGKNQKLNEKYIKDFVKESLSAFNNSGKSELNYSNLISFILRISGLELENLEEIEFTEDNCFDFNLLDDIITNSKVRNDNFNNNKLYMIFDIVCTDIYNNFEITNEFDYNDFKKLIINLLKLSQIKYRKIRLIFSLCLMCLFGNLFDEYISAKKLMEKRSNKKVKSSLEKFITNKNGSLNLEQQTDLHLENKINLLEDFIENLKQKFIFKKITDVSVNIRTMISDYIFRLSKNHFSEFFDDDSIKFFPFFLIDPSNKIKLKYLQIIYDKLEDMDEKDFECIIKVLKESRDLILNICIKEEKSIAKRGIKIIELISKHNILDLKTVNLLLPHLFNPDPNIRNLISNIVLNYILNFESRNVINEANEDEENNENELNEELKNKSKNKKEDLMDICDGNIKDENNINDSPKKADYKYTLENMIEIFEFFSKLTEKDEKMIKVLVDNFYSKMDVFKNFTLFFDLIDLILNKRSVEPAKADSQSEENENRNNSNHEYDKLLKICLIVLKYSIEKLQDEIDNAKTSNEMNNLMKEQIPLNEEFLNHLITRFPSYIRKILINDEIFYETFVETTNLFENFKIYNYNLVKFDLDKVYNILEELQKVFFHNFILKNENEHYFSSNNFMSCAIDNIGKIIIKLINFLSINKLNDDLSRLNEKNVIKEICSRLYDKISSKIINNKIFINEEIKDQISNEQAEELIYLMVRMDCVLNYFGNFSDNFISQLSFVKFQNLIFNLISHYRSKLQLVISERIILFEKQNELDAARKISNKKQNDKKNLDDEAGLDYLEESVKKILLEFNNSEYFLQTLTNYGLKLIKSLNLILLTKIIFNIDTITNENGFSLSASIANPSQSNASLNKLNKHETSHFYETYLKYINNLFINFESFLKFEFNYSLKNKSINNNEVEISQVFNKFIQEKNCLNLEIKSNFLCLILEIIIYISSEKLEMYSSNCDLKMKFQLNDFLLTSIENFLKKEFVFFFYMSSKKLKELNDEIKTVEIQQENEDLDQDELDKFELINEFKKNIEHVISVKTIFLKNICESFSKLLIQNLGMFKNRNLVTLFFETFYLIKYPVIIESINSIVFENLLEKEISYYFKDEENNKINWMIFYFTKISVKLFSKSSSMFNFEEFINKIDLPDSNQRGIKNENEMDVSDGEVNKNELPLIQEAFNFYDFFHLKNYSIIENCEFKSKKNDSQNLILINEEEKLNMLKRYFEVYLKTQKKIKNTYAKEYSQSIENKDKKFLEEFICKSLNYALQSKVIQEIEVESTTVLKKEAELNEDLEENSIEKKLSDKKEKKFEKRINIENIKFFDLIKHILKNSSFITEIEYKTFLMLFVRLVKNIETTDNVNRADIKIIEKMKSYLLNKAKLYINKDDDKEEKSENESDVEENKQENEKEEKTNKKKKETKKAAKKKKKAKQKEENSESEEENDDLDDNSNVNIKRDSKENFSEEEDESEVEENHKAKEKKDKKEKKLNKKEIKNKRETNILSEISDKIGKKRTHEDITKYLKSTDKKIDDDDKQQEKKRKKK